MTDQSNWTPNQQKVVLFKRKLSSHVMDLRQHAESQRVDRYTSLQESVQATENVGEFGGL